MKKNSWVKVKQFSIWGKLVFVFSMILVVFILSYSLLLTVFIHNTYEDNIQYAIDVDERLLFEIKQLKIMAENTSDQLLDNSFIQNSLGIVVSEDEPNELRDVLNTMTRYHGLSNILVINSEGSAYTNNNLLLYPNKVYADFLDYIEGRYDITERKNTWLPLNVNVFQENAEQKENSHIYIYRAVYKLNRPTEQVGNILIQYTDEIFMRPLENVPQREGEFLVLLNEEDRVLASTNPNYPISTDMSDQLESLKYKEMNLYDTKDKSAVVIISEMDADWRLYHSIPYRTLFAEIQTSIILTAFVIAIILVVVLLFLRRLFKSIVHPIKQMEITMDSYGAGNLEARIEEIKNDEIGRCQNGYNSMADRIEKLVQDVETRKRELQKLEVDILSYQINPHFLYNTLDSINWMAQRAGHKDISQIVTALARFFRLSLIVNQEANTVENEISHAEQYLSILRVRYKGTFDYKIEVEDGVRTQKTMHIILQPIIENFFKHGYKQGEQNYIDISVYSENESVIFDVTNNGKKIQEDFLNSLNRDLSGGGIQRRGKSVGLHNINRRIQLNYGNDYGVSIFNAEESGVKVKIKIPLKKQTNSENIKIAK